MNKDLIIKNNDLSEEERLLYFTISRIEEVLKKQSFYQKTDSINALTKIKAYLEEKKNRLAFIEQEQKKLRKELRNTCQHEIILKTDLNTNCAICNRLFIEPPTFEHILIEYDGYLTPSFYQDLDDCIIDTATNTNTLDEFEEKITNKIKQIRLYRRSK